MLMRLKPISVIYKKLFQYLVVVFLFLTVHDGLNSRCKRIVGTLQFESELLPIKHFSQMSNASTFALNRINGSTDNRILRIICEGVESLLFIRSVIRDIENGIINYNVGLKFQLHI